MIPKVIKIRPPGKLTPKDAEDLARFQLSQGIQSDGKLGQQTLDTFWYNLGKEAPSAFDHKQVKVIIALMTLIGFAIGYMVGA